MHLYSAIGMGRHPLDIDLSKHANKSWKDWALKRQFDDSEVGVRRNFESDFKATGEEYFQQSIAFYHVYSYSRKTEEGF